MIRYIVELTNFNVHIYNGHDITEAIDKAEKAGFETSLIHVNDGCTLQIDTFSPIKGWKYGINM